MSPQIVAATEKNLAVAALHLREGKLVAFPTETVYGLGADATNDRAVAEIFAAKGRPSFNPLIVHVRDAEHAREFVEWDARAEKLAGAFWPGAFTLVLPRKKACGISLLVSAGLETVAVRVPAHPVAQGLLRAASLPVAAPSANRSGRVSPTRAEHVMEEFGSGEKIPQSPIPNPQSLLIIDGGSCRVGIESTVLSLEGSTPTLLRPGSVTRGQIEAVAGSIEVARPGAKIAAPGMMEKHYAPSLPVRLNADAPREGEAYLGFGACAAEYNLSPSGDLTEAAANVFALLRQADNPGQFTGIAVAPIPEEGLGIAINDRLWRAAAR